MKFIDFKIYHNEALSHESAESFINESWWPYWAKDLSDDITIFAIKEIFAISHIAGIKDLSEHYSVSLVELCDKFSIPIDTMKKWSRGVNPPPRYLFLLIKYGLFEEAIEKQLEAEKDE